MLFKCFTSLKKTVILIFIYSHADTVVSRRVMSGKGTQSHAKILCPFYNEKACHIIALIAVSADLLTLYNYLVAVKVLKFYNFDSCVFKMHEYPPLYASEV